ncbi:MAG TPA: hypothetical protein VFV34_25200 [Blastocatellia bacterium]|nr:hypothetical protein [Blastocatellia bacterium]
MIPVCCLVALVSWPATRPAAVVADLDTLLRSCARLTDLEIADAAAGKVVTKLLQTADEREMAVFGIVQVDATREMFVQSLRDIERFKRSSEVLEIGKLTSRPIGRDFDRLVLEPSDIEALRGCRPGLCDMKLATSAILRFANEINWASSDYSERTNDLFRRILLDYALQYLARGNNALIEYDDRRGAIRLAEEFNALLAQSTCVNDLAPEFGKYLSEFPSGRPAGAENFIYWSKESFGLKPVISMTHVTIYQRAGGPVLAASKQIYANHYFDASLGLTFFFEQGAGKAAGSYLIYLNRSRVDALGGGFSKLKRTIVAGDLKAGLERNLRLAKRKLEASTSRR